MQPIVWTEDFAIGIDEIDAQHRQLVDMINTLETRKDGDDPEATGRLLQQLDAYVRDHFSLEERLMDAGRFDPEFVARHRGEHRYFRGTLEDFTEDYKSGRRGISAALIEYLVHWLLHHIVVTDREMAQQHHAAGPQHAAQLLATVQHFTDDLTESERHLITELQHSNAALAAMLEAANRASTQPRPAAKAFDAAATTLPEGLVLVAPVAQSAEWESLMRAWQDAIAVHAPGIRIALTYANADGAGLAACIGELEQAGAKHIALAPLLATVALHQQWLGLQQRFTGVKLSLATGVAQAETVVQAFALATLASL